MHNIPIAMSNMALFCVTKDRSSTVQATFELPYCRLPRHLLSFTSLYLSPIIYSFLFTGAARKVVFFQPGALFRCCSPSCASPTLLVLPIWSKTISLDEGFYHYFEETINDSQDLGECEPLRALHILGPSWLQHLSKGQKCKFKMQIAIIVFKNFNRKDLIARQAYLIKDLNKFQKKGSRVVRNRN